MLLHDVAPLWLLFVPAGQLTQLLKEDAPKAVEYDPASHSAQVVDPENEHTYPTTQAKALPQS